MTSLDNLVQYFTTLNTTLSKVIKPSYGFTKAIKFVPTSLQEMIIPSCPELETLCLHQHEEVIECPSILWKGLV